MKEIRIAMWSGPRNVSTAMMRSFENRPDTFVTDEPFYAYFLKKTNYQHPGREEILQSQNSNWEDITNKLTGDIPYDKSVWYQKHMAHHLLSNDNFEWTKSLKNCFLIRHPKDVILSFTKKYELFNSEQLGFPQQKKLLDWLCRETDFTPSIIEAQEVTNNPFEVLQKLCKELDIRFFKSMLSWKKGRRETDGIWAKYWYENVENSTGFTLLSKSKKDIPDQWEFIYEECLEIYKYLLSKKEIDAVIS
jgi:hypothetical protein